MADVLRVKPLARFKLTRNGSTLYDQAFTPTEESYVEHVGERAVLATNMTVVQEINLGGIDTGEKLLLVTDKEIQVGVDSQTALWTVGKSIMLDGGSFTHLYVQNTSTQVEATIEYIATD